jgi:hypothetical protein
MIDTDMINYNKIFILCLIGMLLTLNSCYYSQKKRDEKPCPIPPDPVVKVTQSTRKGHSVRPVCYNGTMYLEGDNGSITVLPDNDKDGWFECTAHMPIKPHTIGCWRGYEIYYFDNGSVAPVIYKGKYKECKDE